MKGGDNKANVGQFDGDASAHGGYVYTRTERLSARLSNGRMSRAMEAAASYAGKTVLDIGCGDGTFTAELADLGPRSILGLDPAQRAVERARDSCAARPNVEFQVGNVYELSHWDRRFDIVVLRGVLHHLPEPERAVRIACGLGHEVVVLEPNGANPVLKIIERTSRYHIDHEEQSFLPRVIDAWFTGAGATIVHRERINLVPIFCPDWMASTLALFQPLAERTPLVRNVACGQYVVRANSGLASPRLRGTDS